MTAATKANSSLSEIPSGIWALGFALNLMDFSSGMIDALLSVYLVTVLGTSMVRAGVIKGVTEATASITKIFSGALWDAAGPKGTFFAGACFALLAFAGLLAARGKIGLTIVE
ncbi:hypothetical protein [Bradyrhizobium lablabi]|jgi:hypothetical protein|uniref:MFS transporter n=2 Tax=Bradyrhizobium TaxID=374 RepID=A0ABY0QGG2_9BRAD|nr:hypothetical protein SAMN05444163_7789 [Bradyrhizobium ottawaense]SEE40593.1 hypothetical protein SAMN05444171_7345 [Bradyrhizobium lablabi]